MDAYFDADLRIDDWLLMFWCETITIGELLGEN